MRSMSKSSGSRTRVAVLAIAMLIFGALQAPAQVPQDTGFSGRLVDGAGNPLSGSVTFDLIIFDAPTGGPALYSERHTVSLDGQGGFSVLLGSGSITGLGLPPYGAALFYEPERYVEVRLISPTSEILAPRVPIASTPWALVAEQALAIARDPNAPRFEDCGDGTLADHETGLQWEMKTGDSATEAGFCDTVACPDPHLWRNLYTWSLTGTAPDGSAFTDFLARLNGEFDPVAASGCFAGHCDWELPKISQFQTIMVGPGAAPGQPATCSQHPCIDPGFKAIEERINWTDTWSASTVIGNPTFAWSMYAHLGLVNNDGSKTDIGWVRAVRRGTCN